MSNIEWTDKTWNPITGCTRVSAGCDNCYAAKMTKRLEAMGTPGYEGLVHHGHFNGVVRCHENKLDIPLRWRKPWRIFVNSMSDLFHDKVPFGFIDKVFAVMALCPQHTFQILTKRPDRMAEYLGRRMATFDVALACQLLDPAIMADGPHVSVDLRDLGIGWPLPNVWLGTSCEDQATADERIPHLLKCPAAVRFLSMEPLLGSIRLPVIEDTGEDMPASERREWGLPATTMGDDGVAIHWVIVGGESGPKCRPMKDEWAIDIVKQCRASGTPVFVKQLGGYPKARKDMSEWPEELRVREWPKQGEARTTSEQFGTKSRRGEL